MPEIKPIILRTIKAAWKKFRHLFSIWIIMRTIIIFAVMLYLVAAQIKEKVSDVLIP